MKDEFLRFLKAYNYNEVIKGNNALFDVMSMNENMTIIFSAESPTNLVEVSNSKNGCVAIGLESFSSIKEAFNYLLEVLGIEF